MHEWQIHVTGVGCIGTVHERNDTLARCAALSRYGEDGLRANADARHEARGTLSSKCFGSTRTCVAASLN